jgi:hypothetical protein
MGVDYSAYYGIGIQVDKEDEISIDSFLEDEVENEEYSFFETGSASYGGDAEYYVIIKDPFKNGLNNLEKQKETLLYYLDSKGLTTIGEFGVVGGLLID